ncbi:hypothetical protein TA3x_001308 [Tundrisphaera sp. TA3]|uniref:hypothetical protein n=1 Tax=Tundrisphaera sp. TA3 TaxID=3435775 RepID=UPI003EC0E899
MRQSRITDAVRFRRVGQWAFTAIISCSVSGMLAGCGGSSHQTGEMVQADPIVQQQVKSMSEYYKTNPPGKARRK